MNYGLLFRTVRYLKPTQVIYQVKNRLIKPAYKEYDTSGFKILVSGFKAEPIAKYNCLEGNVFTFLNLAHEFAGWNYTENGMLWAYNQNYFDWINQEGVFEEEGCKWIDKFIKGLPNNKVGLDPYPIALRSINWVKFFCRNPESATILRLDSLYSQLKLLEEKLEYHLLANHLLEDVYALYIGAVFFGDKKLLNKSSKLLKKQLKEQILPDGAHYEQSPMYHCILLDRLLDVINIANNEVRCQMEDVRCFSEYAERMLGHLESIMWADGGIPMMNDSANGIAPKALDLFDYAKRLGLEWKAKPMKECGYRKLKDEYLEALVDVGNITATYQPGHTHADTFSYELRLNGVPLVVDTGVSSYNKNERRQYERSTKAHNTVSIREENSSEVWGGFRVGRRAVVTVYEDDKNMIKASHNGFKEGVVHRFFSVSNRSFCITDTVSSNSICYNYIHLAPSVGDISIVGNTICGRSFLIELEGVDSVDIQKDNISLEYNSYKEHNVVVMKFKKQMSYQIRLY